ncbi:MAG: hypothetical protein ACI8VW_003871 [bacterium]|jgi:hypothetical protein
MNVNRHLHLNPVGGAAGMDSMTLARSIKNKLIIVHATSPAVPVEATERVKRYAK